MGSDRRTTVRLGTRTSRLSLAVRLVDRFTDRNPVGSPRVRLEDRDVEPITNPSGYRLFLDLEPGTVTVTVDGGRQYVDERVTGVDAIDLSDPNTTVDPSDPATLPLETVRLAPSPAYRFPNGTTLVRGTVSDPNGEPLQDAHVSIVDRDAQTRTDANGEFVLFFEPVTAEHVATVDGRTVVEVEGDAPKIAVSHPVQGNVDVRLEDDDGDSIVEEGTLTVHDITYP